MTDIVPGRKESGLRSNLVVLALAATVSVVAGLAAVKPVVDYIDLIVRWHTDLVPVAFAAGVALSVAFAWIKYPSRAPYLRIVLVGVSLLLGIHNLWMGYDFPVANADVHAAVAPFTSIAGWMTIAAMALSVVRPSFAVITSVTLVFQKSLAVHMSGGYTGHHHYIVLADLAIFAVITIILFETARALWHKAEPDTDEASAEEQRFIDGFWLVVMCIILGAHLGNYFLSGYGKVALDGGPLSWVLENKTQYLLLGGYNLGAAPLSGVPPLFGVVYWTLSHAYIPLNTVVLMAQFLCFAAFASRTWMIRLIVFFDIMHLTIFALTGALFFHWIVLNSVLLLAVARMPATFAPRFALVIGALVTVAGHHVFHTVRLAWYDNREVRDDRFIAVYADGSEAHVPPSFFRESSYLFYNRGFELPRDPAQRDRVLEETAPLLAQVEPQAQTYGWGQNHRIEAKRQSETCALPLSASGPVAADFDAAEARTYVTARHDWAMDRLNAGKPLNYHPFPHDHFSLPWNFQAFESRDVRDIVAYYYTVETVCLDWANGGLERDVITRTQTIPFDVTGNRE